MAAYRFYFLDIHNHIAGVEDAICANDTQAAKVAVNFFAAHERRLIIEVWKNERRVSRHSIYAEAFWDPEPWWRIAMARLWGIAEQPDIAAVRAAE